MTKWQRQRSGPECWTAEQLSQFLAATRHLRLHPALHLAAFTGMRRGELAGLRWGDWHRTTHRLSIARSRQVVAGRSVEVAVKTRTSRRCIDLDADTEKVLRSWRRRQQRDGHTVGTSDPIFTNATGRPVHPESIYQLFHRQVRRLDMPRICFHGLRHTHASLLVAAGTPIKVVSERLGHANPGFTMATYQHVLPGIGADAATRFARLIAVDRKSVEDRPPRGGPERPAAEAAAASPTAASGASATASSSRPKRPSGFGNYCTWWMPSRRP